MRVAAALRWLPRILAVVSLLAIGSGEVRAESGVTADFRRLLEFVCGGDPSSCLDRKPALSDSDIDELGAELARLVANSEYRDQIDESVRIEADLLRLCAEDEARCRVWVEKLARSGAIDADVDGVLDGLDACPGTSTPVGRAQSILLAQQVALTEVREELIELRVLLIEAANGTLGSAERYRLGETAVGFFYELVSIGNKKVDGRHLFGGQRDALPPFALSGTFGPDAPPLVTYQGDIRPLRLPVGRSGEAVPISIPGARLFLADFDGDGSFPDDRGIDLFELLIEAQDALHANDVERIFTILSIVDEAIGGQIAEAQRQNGATYAAIRRSFPRRELTDVDPSGCTQEQFCRSAGVARPHDAEVCSASDFLNDEPLLIAPRDCRVERVRGADLRCVPWRTTRQP